MNKALLLTILFTAILPLALVGIGALMGGADAVPYNMAATMAVLIGTVVKMSGDARDG